MIVAGASIGAFNALARLLQASGAKVTREYYFNDHGSQIDRFARSVLAAYLGEQMAGAEGYGRVDMRVAENGQPYIIEVNPCPDLSSNAGLARMGRAFGWDYDALVIEIVNEALNRSQSARAAAALAGGTVPA